MYNEFDSDNQDSSNLSFVAGLFTGAVIGAGVGLLFAPRPGSELRGRLADSASAMGRRMSETIDAVADAGRDAYQQARDVATTAGNELRSAAGDVSSGVEKGTAAIRNAASGVRSGSTGGSGSSDRTPAGPGLYAERVNERVTRSFASVMQRGSAPAAGDRRHRRRHPTGKGFARRAGNDQCDSDVSTAADARPGASAPTRAASGTDAGSSADQSHPRTGA